ncbi:MAG: acyl carrier protein [Saprospiraceae bacterium]|nr:acyl carrier protein [Saprospiraceae bacterium]MBK8632213.1 acyl carrier protein [Saprospiraceae bacterium]MBP7641837.1 acyl carrier protein [Saprospiraceae bacterium]HMS69593.1 phosphopantetheine-binding protein [Saprospiraceae bacterium]
MHTKLLEIINIVLTNNDLPIIEELNPDQTLQNDLGMDSINLAELSVRLEDAYEVDVFEEGMVFSVGELMHKLIK